MSFTSTSKTVATLYHCPCETPAASTSYHPLPSLYFCTECDSIQCPECMLEEVSSYYCPNCLFEVPSASVRAEKNRCVGIYRSAASQYRLLRHRVCLAGLYRCARNCFLCPCCSNTLAVVPSDPADPSVTDNPLTPQASIGEPPYFLSCLACKWDSKVVGITFDKPTGLAGRFTLFIVPLTYFRLNCSLSLAAAQLQKAEESSLASTQYESIREHLEPWLKAGLSAEQAALQASSHKSTAAHHRTTGAIAAAARALNHSHTTMSRNIPSSIASASRFNSLHNLAAMHRSSSLRSGLGRDDIAGTVTQRDELADYQTKHKLKPNLAESEGNRAQAMKMASSTEEMAKVDQKWYISANQRLKMNELHPLRIPLRSKKTKRCPTCRSILIKPDTKAGSTRFKMRVVASTYLPQIVSLICPSTA